MWCVFVVERERAVQGDFRRGNGSDLISCIDRLRRKISSVMNLSLLT